MEGGAKLLVQVAIATERAEPRQLSTHATRQATLLHSRSPGPVRPSVTSERSISRTDSERKGHAAVSTTSSWTQGFPACVQLPVPGNNALPSPSEQPSSSQVFPSRLLAEEEMGRPIHREQPQGSRPSPPQPYRIWKASRGEG